MWPRSTAVLQDLPIGATYPFQGVSQLGQTVERTLLVNVLGEPYHVRRHRLVFAYYRRKRIAHDATKQAGPLSQTLLVSGNGSSNELCDQRTPRGQTHLFGHTLIPVRGAGRRLRGSRRVLASGGDVIAFPHRSLFFGRHVVQSPMNRLVQRRPVRQRRFECFRCPPLSSRKCRLGYQPVRIPFAGFDRFTARLFYEKRPHLPAARTRVQSQLSPTRTDPDELIEVVLAATGQPLCLCHARILFNLLLRDSRPVHAEAMRTRHDRSLRGTFDANMKFPLPPFDRSRAEGKRQTQIQRSERRP